MRICIGVTQVWVGGKAMDRNHWGFQRLQGNEPPTLSLLAAFI
ncbi:hypothetical protein ACYZT3_19340 [Pseudomonas sp. MDT1-16]|nr:hypothetical protein [Pseudomonas sp. AL03]MDI3272063.1 hypothetical protein [Pseudomonas sp. AL03]